MADEDDDQRDDDLDEEGAAAAAAVAALVALIGDDVAKALATEDDERRTALLSALAAQSFTLAYEQAGGTGSSAEEARAYVFSLRPAFGLLQPDGSESQHERMTDIIAHSAVNAGSLAAAMDNAGPDADIKFEWRTQRDDKVRDLHKPVDGQMRAAGQAFDVGGHPQRYPGHPVGPPEAWINCRCYLRIDQTVTAATEEPEPEHTGIAVVAKPRDPQALAQPGGLPADELHVTLGFFGNTDNPDISPDLRDRLEAYLAENPLNPHAAHVGGVAYMGDDDPQALALLLESGDLADTRRSLEGYATPDSLHPHFTPHMTLGYGVPMPDSHPTDIDLDHTELWWGEERLGGPTVTAAQTVASDGLVAREFDTAKRKQMAKAHTAMPDGSYPIANEEDLKNAIQAIGRAKNPDAVKAHIRRRAKALGLTELIPDSWTASANHPPEGAIRAWAPSTSPPGTHDAPGWLTNPEETQRLRTYWTKGEGAAKIRWGQPGDFDRCRKQLAKYVQNPSFLAGTCANLHFVALGFWPNQGPHAGKHGSKKADGECVECQDFDPDNTDPQGAAVTAAFSAVAELDDARPPREWFTDPGLDGPTALTVTDEGEVLGHIGYWNQCHVGFGEGDSCVHPPHSTRDYAHFRTGYVATAGGNVAVGNLTLGTGHAADGISATSTIAHYDNTGTAVADVAAGEDEHGIWVHGMLRPGVTAEQVHALRAGTPSGDWRTIGGQYELVAALIVNVPGFPIPRPHETLAASGEPLSLIAAGMVMPDPNALDVDRIAIAVVNRLDDRERRAANRARVATLRSLVNTDRVAELVAAVEGTP